jgi:uncharacterized protein
MTSVVQSQTIEPFAPASRILSIDVLRGFAVLGILIMNIQSFSMIFEAYSNPTAYGDLTGLNKWVWVLSHLLASEKFMTIFSMLFGAGVLLFIDKARSAGKKAGSLHYRRNFWLLLFGMAHAYLIWYGDILVAYSLCAFFVYLFRNKKPITLLILGMIFFLVPVILYLFMGYSIPYWPKEQLELNMQNWKPSVEKIQEEVSNMQGSWSQQMEERVPTTVFMQAFVFLIYMFWRVTGLMLIGMALYKWEVLSALRSRIFYIRMSLIGLVLGYGIVGYGIYRNFQANWSYEYSMFIGSQFNYVASIGVALGYIGIIMLICKSDHFRQFRNIFSSVGKMAFTNYILMSLICTFIFYGHGLGLYGEVERTGQILMVFGIWILLMIISTLWLKHYRFGPLEWLWRSLTYWRSQPMKKDVSASFISTRT